MDGSLKHFVESGSVVSKAQSGKQKVTALSEDQYIKLRSLRDRKTTLVQNLLFEDSNTPIKSPVKGRACLRG